MSFCSDNQIVKARKSHKCTWCSESIEKGARYNKWNYVDDAWFTNKMHPECLECFQEDARVTGEWSYMPYDNERPTGAKP